MMVTSATRLRNCKESKAKRGRRRRHGQLTTRPSFELEEGANKKTKDNYLDGKSKPRRAVAIAAQGMSFFAPEGLRDQYETEYVPWELKKSK